MGDPFDRDATVLDGCAVASQSPSAAWRRARSAFVSVAYATSRTTSDENANSPSPRSTGHARRAGRGRRRGRGRRGGGRRAVRTASREPLVPTIAQSSSTLRSAGPSASSRAATRPCRVAGSGAGRARCAGGPVPPVSRSSATSSSRKNGLPPLRSSRKREHLGGARRSPSSSETSSSTAASTSSGSRFEHDCVVAARPPAASARRARAGPWRRSTNGQARQDARASRSTRSSTRSSAQCRSDRTHDDGTLGARALEEGQHRPQRVVAGARRVDVAQRGPRSP